MDNTQLELLDWGFLQQEAELLCTSIQRNDVDLSSCHSMQTDRKGKRGKVLSLGVEEREGDLNSFTRMLRGLRK